MRARSEPATRILANAATSHSVDTGATMAFADEIRRHLWAMGIIAAAAGLVSLVLWRLFPSRRLFPLQRQPTGHWTGREVALVFLCYVLAASLVFGLLEQLGFFEIVYDGPVSLVRKQLWV